MAWKSEGTGRPMLFHIITYFLDYFGINSIADLPQPKDFEDNTTSNIGEISE